jgi:hypothetical protein
MTRYKTTQDGTFPFTPEEEAEWDAMEAEWVAGESDRKASAIREQRNQLLKETDWMAGSDVTMSDDWKTYRQALRDITLQDSFPDSVTWPDKP